MSIKFTSCIFQRTASAGILDQQSVSLYNFLLFIQFLRKTRINLYLTISIIDNKFLQSCKIKQKSRIFTILKIVGEELFVRYYRRERDVLLFYKWH